MKSHLRVGELGSSLREAFWHHEMATPLFRPLKRLRSKVSPAAALGLGDQVGHRSDLLSEHDRQKPRPLKRLRSKVNDAAAFDLGVQEDLPSDLFNEHDRQKLQVYLITCSHPVQTHASSGVALRPPNSYSRQHLLNALLDSCQRPMYDKGNGSKALGGVRLRRCLIAAEYHKTGADGQTNRHYHIAVQAFASFRFGAVKAALLSRHGIATHWSTTHLGYWSALSYLVRPSEKKPATCLDPKPLAWHVDGVEENLRELSQRPTTAASIEARREKAVELAEKEGKQEPKPSEMDVWPIIVKHDIRNDHDNQDGVDKLIRLAKLSCSPSMIQFLFRIRHKLASLIDDVWRWETVDDRLLVSQRSRLEALQDAMHTPCVCGGEWTKHVAESLHVNNIPAAELAHYIYLSLSQGRSETTPVVCLAGLQGGEGKSLIFYPLPAVLGEEMVQHHTASGAFPLLGIEGKKAVTLDEWSFSGAPVSLSTQLLWFEGKPVPITRPQNNSIGHFLYKGTAPIFVTTPLQKMEPFLKQAEDASRRGVSSEATMILRRIKLYKFEHKVRKPACQIPQCASCFASFVLEGEAMHSRGQ